MESLRILDIPDGALTEKYMMKATLEYATKEKKLVIHSGVTDCENMVCHVEPFISEEVTRQKHVC